MSTPIRTWTDAYAAIRDTIEARRGFIELAPNTPQATRWPRATGAHVVAIAAVLDPPLRTSPPAFGRAALLQQWRDVLIDAETTALLEPARTYPTARAFWAAARAVCVHLDHVGVRVPDEAHWQALLELLDQDDDAPGRRNGDGMPSDDLFAERQALLAKRGSDGQPILNGLVSYPKATVSEIVGLTIRWNDRLAALMRADPGQLTQAAVEWHKTVDDIIATTRGVPGDQVYAHGRAFWHGATLLARAMDAALTRDANRRLLGLIADTAHEVDDRIEGTADAVADGVVAAAHGVPAALSASADAAGDLLSGAGRGVGKALGGLAGGLLSPFVLPLAIGGGAIGLYLLTRDRDAKEAA
ncbi:MAG: hypothetical protein K8W52_37880 [Deltaproteobacteria bacterium]|nr:hypothetical protein [Deltaproteobacteria bacterium]